MKLTLRNPTELILEELDDKQLQEVRANLTYRDQKVSYELRKFKSNRWSFQTLGEEAYNARLADLTARSKVCLLEKNQEDQLWCLSGMRNYLESKYSIRAEIQVKYPDEKLIPWLKVPDRTPHPFQLEAKEKLLEARHARVEIGTGLGKSFIILNLVKQLGLKTVIMAPSQNIAEQLHDEFVLHFGKKNVGAFFDGKKDFKKLFIVGTGQSLTRVEPDSPAGKALAGVQCFVADESHQCPAATLAKVCTGVLKGAPYRFFFSATQMRNDGRDLLLDAITGPTVYEKTVRQGVDEGFLAKPVFRMIRAESNRALDSNDANEMTREHMYRNPDVNQKAAAIINHSVEHLGHQVLVLIDEVEQFAKLLPLLKHKAMFAHGPLTSTKFKKDKLGNVLLDAAGRPIELEKGNRDWVPAQYQEVDNGELVRSFNRCDYPILIGTSCVSTGTDIRSVKTMVYLKGGKSEIEVRQGVGRCTRLEKNLGKTACVIYDFDVENIDILHRHAQARLKIYDDIYGPTTVMTL